MNIFTANLKATLQKDENSVKEERPETLYNWQLCTWPNFQYEHSHIQRILNAYQSEVAILTEKFNHLSQSQQRAVEQQLMELESTILGKEELRKHHSMGAVQVMVLINETFQAPLSKEQIFKYYKTVFYVSGQPNRKNSPKWREWKLYVVGKDENGEKRIIYRPLPPEKINQEMTKFINWFSQTDPINGTAKIPGPIRAAITYLYFESIHPFRDGNGRIGRALVKKALLQDLKGPLFNFPSNLKSIHHVLNATQKNADITPWVTAFINLLYKDLLNSKQQILTILKDAESFKEE